MKRFFIIETNVEIYIHILPLNAYKNYLSELLSQYMIKILSRVLEKSDSCFVVLFRVKKIKNENISLNISAMKNHMNFFKF